MSPFFKKIQSFSFRFLWKKYWKRSMVSRWSSKSFYKCRAKWRFLPISWHSRLLLITQIQLLSGFHLFTTIKLRILNMIIISVFSILKIFVISFMNKDLIKFTMKLILLNSCKSSKLVIIKMKTNPINSKKWKRQMTHIETTTTQPKLEE